MTRSSSQRGVSLLLLIIAITVFAAVAIGIVTLLRSRHESYPYQVQSYQAYALAHAGVEFAIRLAMENSDWMIQTVSSIIRSTTYLRTVPTRPTSSAMAGSLCAMPRAARTLRT